MDVLPIIAILFAFQFAVIRQPISNISRVIVGFIWVLLGLSLFLIGLQWALFPLGKLVAQQLTDPQFIAGIDQSIQLMTQPVQRIELARLWLGLCFCFFISNYVCYGLCTNISMASAKNEIFEKN
jgi:hypothetical protein